MNVNQWLALQSQSTLNSQYSGSYSKPDSPCTMMVVLVVFWPMMLLPTHSYTVPFVGTTIMARGTAGGLLLYFMSLTPSGENKFELSWGRKYVFTITLSYSCHFQIIFTCITCSSSFFKKKKKISLCVIPLA